MYHILVVDDEKIERRGISFLLKKMGWEVELAEAPNGKAALEYLENHTVDLLLTDVKMPFMDGLELVEKLQEKKLDMKTIIFSGHNDFEYAKKAMRAGVSDYILKPVDPKEFKNTLEKVAKELEQSRQENRIREKGMGFLREHILYHLVNGSDMEKLRKEAGSMLSLEEFNSYRHMLLLEFNEDFFGREGVGFEEAFREASGLSYEYLNLNPQQSLFFLETGTVPAEFAEILSSHLHEKYQKKAYMAVSTEFSGYEQIPEKMEELELLMENKFYQTDQFLFLPDAQGDAPVLVQIDDDALMKQMKQDIRMKDITGLREHFERMCVKYRKKTDFSHVYIKFIFSSLLKDLYSSFPAGEAQELNKEIDQLYRSNSFQTIMDIINKNIGRLEEAFSANPQMLHREIESVKQYIYEHYAEELSVDSLAEKVYMAPSYLSSVFKKETGQNLSKFIKAYRMEKAKEMLEETHQKIVTVSNSVGYSNVSYFCQSFREYFGISPQKFREQGSQ